MINLCLSSILILGETIGKWQKPTSLVGNDLPRLVHCMSVLKKNDNKVVFRGTNGVNPVDQMAQLVQVLGEGINVDVDVSSLFTSSVVEGVPEDSQIKYDLGKLVQNFIHKVGEDTKLVKLFNACSSQGIIAPAWLYLRLSVLQDFPFKDLKQSWVIYIILNETEISVIHQVPPNQMHQ